MSLFHLCVIPFVYILRILWTNALYCRLFPANVTRFGRDAPTHSFTLSSHCILCLRWPTSLHFSIVGLPMACSECPSALPQCPCPTCFPPVKSLEQAAVLEVVLTRRNFKVWARSDCFPTIEVELTPSVRTVAWGCSWWWHRWRRRIRTERCWCPGQSCWGGACIFGNLVENCSVFVGEGSPTPTRARTRHVVGVGGAREVSVDFLRLSTLVDITWRVLTSRDASWVPRRVHRSAHELRWVGLGWSCFSSAFFWRIWVKSVASTLRRRCGLNYITLASSDGFQNGAIFNVWTRFSLAI